MKMTPFFYFKKENGNEEKNTGVTRNLISKTNTLLGLTRAALFKSRIKVFFANLLVLLAPIKLEVIQSPFLNQHKSTLISSSITANNTIPALSNNLFSGGP